MKKVRDASKDWVEYGKERMKKAADAGKDRDEYGTVRNRWIHQCELRMSDVPDQVDSDQSLLEHCAAKGNSSISPETLNCLQTFKDDPSAVGLVLKNASIGALPADPNQASRQAKWSAAVVTQFFGMPVGYEELASTTTFKYIYSPPIDNKSVDGPQQSFVGNYTTDDSDRVYGWHIENMAHPLMPGVVVMLCLKPDLEKTAETLFLPAEDVVKRLSDKSKKLLQEFRFKLQIEDTLDLDGVKEIPYAMPVLKQDSDGAWHIYLDGSFTRPLDEEAKEALAELLEVAESAFVGVKLDKGDVLVWKNSRAAHDVRNRGSDRRLLRLHAFTGSDSPFEKFQGWPAQFVKATTEPNVMATRGMFTAEENCLPHTS
jgi:L-asparagine oxygenase